MRRIAIIGTTGMLGSMVYNVLKHKHSLVLIYRDPIKLALLDKVYSGVKHHRSICFNVNTIYTDYLLKRKKPSGYLKTLIDKIGAVDAVINCIGVIRPLVQKDQSSTFFLNSALPHLLSTQYKDKLIHVSTDCVYDGKLGAPYTEDYPPNPRDIYGLSKTIGEPQALSLVIRTSLIGPELAGSVSLLGWFMRYQGKSIPGYVNHIWNGVTTKQFGHICESLITNRQAFPSHGLFHVFSDAHTKYEILNLFKRKYNKKINLVPTKAPEKIDRRLASVYSYCQSLQIPPLEKMIQDL